MKKEFAFPGLVFYVHISKSPDGSVILVVQHLVEKGGNVTFGEFARQYIVHRDILDIVVETLIEDLVDRIPYCLTQCIFVKINCYLHLCADSYQI